MTATTNLRKQKAPSTVIKDVLRASQGFASVYLVFLGGEPMMVGPEWFREAFAYANATKFNIAKRIYTNGHLLNKEWSDLFKKENCQVIISYDGLGNGPKGSPRSLQKIQEHADLITYVSMTLSESNYKGLIECYKEVSAAGVKRFSLQFDIYAPSELMTLFGKEVCKLFAYIEANPKGAKVTTYTDAKSVVSGRGIRTSTEFHAASINNDFCINADGMITLGVPDCDAPEWQLGYIKDTKHINDIVYSEQMRQVNSDYVESLNLIGEFAEVNRLTNGGGFFFDKKGVQPMNRPNMTKLHCYREILRYFGDV